MAKRATLRPVTDATLVRLKGLAQNYGKAQAFYPIDGYVLLNIVVELQVWRAKKSQDTHQDT